MAVYALIALGVLVYLLAMLSRPGDTVTFVIVMLLMLGYLCFRIWTNLSLLLKYKKYYGQVRDSGLLQSLRSVDPYPTEEARQYAFQQEQQQRRIYADKQFCMTDHFLSSSKGILLISGILDARITVRKVNGVMDKLELAVLYYTGEKTTFFYTRPFGFSNGRIMNEQLANLQFAVNVMAAKSPLFRKYDACRLD